jgi:6-pyruvoyltetrahydropterin/6-carboxytetrahydropterin synthase
MLITRTAEFSASHVCRSPALTDEENRDIYGLESNPRGHGHNFVLEVTLEGQPDPATGMVYDLKKLKSLLEREIIQPFDHRFLNLEVPPFDRVIPTPENLAIEIWKRLEPCFREPGVRLRSVRLYETEDLYVDYDGVAS